MHYISSSMVIAKKLYCMFGSSLSWRENTLMQIYASWPLNICHSADGKTKTEFFSGFVSIDVIGWNEMKWNEMEWSGMECDSIV